MELDFRIIQFVNVILYILRIGSDDGAVVMVNRILKFFPLVRNAGVEDIFDPLFDQPRYMSVCQFGWVAL